MTNPVMRKDPHARTSDYLRNLRYATYPEAATRIPAPKALPDHIVMHKDIFNCLFDDHWQGLWSQTDLTVYGISFQVGLNQGDVSSLAGIALLEGKTVQIWL